MDHKGSKGAKWCDYVSGFLYYDYDNHIGVTPDADGMITKLMVHGTVVELNTNKLDELVSALTWVQRRKTMDYGSGK